MKVPVGGDRPFADARIRPRNGGPSGPPAIRGSRRHQTPAPMEGDRLAAAELLAESVCVDTPRSSCGTVCATCRPRGCTGDRCGGCGGRGARRAARRHDSEKRARGPGAGVADGPASRRRVPPAGRARGRLAGGDARIRLSPPLMSCQRHTTS